MGISNQLPSSRISQAGVIPNAAARPASPFEGQLVYELDTNRVLVWDGSVWVSPNSTTANPPGLELVKSQTVGTTVSSVTVNDAFSATYDNYKIILTGGVSSVDTDLQMTLGSTVTGYAYVLIYVAWGSAGVQNLTLNNTSSFPYAGSVRTNGLSLDVDIRQPFKTARTWVHSPYVGLNTASVGGNFTGFVNNTTSYTGFTLTPATGTLTGGIIRVYGYRN